MIILRDDENVSLPLDNLSLSTTKKKQNGLKNELWNPINDIFFNSTEMPIKHTTSMNVNSN